MLSEAFVFCWCVLKIMKTRGGVRLLTFSERSHQGSPVAQEFFFLIFIVGPFRFSGAYVHHCRGKKYGYL